MMNLIEFTGQIKKLNSDLAIRGNNDHDLMLGLFGLIAFTAEQRTKKSEPESLRCFRCGPCKIIVDRFLLLVLVAFVIASPIAWWIMNKWLQDFAYHIHISWWIFAIAGAVAFTITMLTVSFQA
jgi:putative ABC transport system permease protein